MRCPIHQPLSLMPLSANVIPMTWRLECLIYQRYLRTLRSVPKTPSAASSGNQVRVDIDRRQALGWSFKMSKTVLNEASFASPLIEILALINMNFAHLAFTAHAHMLEETVRARPDVCLPTALNILTGVTRSGLPLPNLFPVLSDPVRRAMSLLVRYPAKRAISALQASQRC